MAEIPNELAQSIKTGDCVLWAGAGFGALVGRPGWAELLGRLIPTCPDAVQPQLRDLLEQGRLRTVLSYIHRHFGDEPLAALLKEVSSQSGGITVDEGVRRLAEIPWRACFATTYADVLYQIFDGAGQPMDVISHTDAHHLSLRERKEPFILRTPPTGRSMRADQVFFELVEEIVRTRTILFLGFDIDDPDLFQILDLLGRVGRGNTHFAWLPFVTDAEAEEIREQYGIEVLQAPDEIVLTDAFRQLLGACEGLSAGASLADDHLNVLDLARALKGIDLRADLALDSALTLELPEIERLMERIPGGNLGRIDPGTLLRLGCVMLAHEQIEHARRCFQHVVSRGVGREYQNLARFNLANVAFVEGDVYSAVEGFNGCAEADRTLALVPPRFQIVEVLGREGTRMLFSCRDRETEEHLNIAVGALARPVGAREHDRFQEQLQQLVALDHRSVKHVRGGFADGHLFGVMSDAVPGFVLADTLDKDERLDIGRAFEIITPLLEGLDVCHRSGVVHRNITPKQILLTPDGPVLRGFGFPPVVSYRRNSVRQANLGYMAPELFLDTEATAASDLYSLAAVFYRCITGATPAGAVLPVTSFGPELDQRLDSVFQQALHPSPERRPSPAGFHEQIQRIMTTPAPDAAAAAPTAVEAPQPEPAADKAVDARFEELMRKEADLAAREAAIRLREEAAAEVGESREGQEVALQREQAAARAEEAALQREQAAARAEEAAVQREQAAARAEEAARQLESAAATAMQQAQAGEPEPGVPVGTPEEITIPPSSQIRLPEDVDDLEAWAWILERRPTHKEAREAIARIEAEAREEGRLDRLSEVLNVRAQNTQVQQERVDLLRELAGMFEKDLGAPAGAFATLQTLIEEVPVPVQVQLLSDLQRVGALAGNWSQLANTITLVAGRVQDPEQQAPLYVDLGTIYADQLGAADNAVACYAKALELQPESKEVLNAAVPLYRRLGRHPELAAALLTVAELETGEERHAHLFEAAQLLHSRLEDDEGAFEALELLRREVPDHAEAIEMAEVLARVLERWDALVSVLSQRAEVADDREAAECRREAATLALEKLGDRESAIEQYRKLVERDRSDREGARRLVDLLRAASAEDPAHRVALVEGLYLLIELSEATDERRQLLAECAALLDRESDGADRAADCREQILSITALDQSDARQAAEALERHYRGQEAYSALSELYLRQGEEQQADAQFRREAWEKLLELRRGPLDDAPGVVAALEALAKLDPENTKYRDELLERYLEAEDFEKAGPIIRAQVDAESDPLRKADLLIRGGKLREQIGKVDGAIEAYQEALGLDASRTDGWTALRDLYAQRGEPLKALEAQVEAARSTKNTLEKTKMFYEAARDCLEQLDEPERGMSLLKEVVELDPDHRAATEMLLDRFIALGDLPGALPVSEMFVRQARSQAPEDHALNLRALGLAGRCALAAEETERAVEYLEKAKALDASDVEVLRLLADLHLEGGRFDEALSNYQSVVLASGDRLLAGEQADLYVRMARACIGMDQKKKGTQMAERALELDGDSEDATRLAIDLADEVSGPAERARAKRRLVDLLIRREEGQDEETVARLKEERVQVLRQLAELQADELNLPEEAVRTLEEVLELRAGDPAVLHRILDLFTETVGTTRGKYLYAGAAILRDQLGDSDAAIEWFRNVLTADPLHEKAFRSSCELLERSRAWRDLARVIRERLKALPETADPEERVALFDRLGRVYEQHLEDPVTALAAFEQAVKLAPATIPADDEPLLDRRRKVLDLAISLGDDELEKAVTAAHALIAARPMDFGFYHQLVDLYLRQQRRDRARLMARGLKFLKQATEAELELAEIGDDSFVQARGNITREMWRQSVYHPLESSQLSDVFSIIWPMVAAHEGRTHAHYSIERKDRASVSIQAPDPLARFIAYACQILDAPVPDFFRREDEIGGLVTAALADVEGGQVRTVFPSVLAGKDALAKQSEQAWAFRAARAVARARPEHILAAVLPSGTSLRHAIYGAVMVSHPGVAIPADCQDAARRYGQEIQRYLPPARLDQLKTLVTRLIEGGSADTRAWVQGVDYTVTRLGFVLSDDLETSVRIVTQEGDEGSLVPARDRMKDLVAYAVSEEYFDLRKALNMPR
jgi:tetratricopeptide (TPR) repeat protein